MDSQSRLQNPARRQENKRLDHLPQVLAVSVIKSAQMVQMAKRVQKFALAVAEIRLQSHRQLLPAKKVERLTPPQQVMGAFAITSAPIMVWMAKYAQKFALVTAAMLQHRHRSLPRAKKEERANPPPRQVAQLKEASRAQRNLDQQREHKLSINVVSFSTDDSLAPLQVTLVVPSIRDRVESSQEESEKRPLTTPTTCLTLGRRDIMDSFRSRDSSRATNELFSRVVRHNQASPSILSFSVTFHHKILLSFSW